MSEYDKRRRMFRRAIAAVSYALMSIMGSYIIISGVASADMAKNIVSMTGPIGIVFGAWTTLIGTYFAASAYNSSQGSFDPGDPLI